MPSLAQIVNEINAVLLNSKYDVFSKLNRIHSIVAENRGKIVKNGSVAKQISDIEYALAYDALLSGADPSKVLGLIDFDNTREKIMGDINSIGKTIIMQSIAEQKYDRAQQLLEEYKPYLDSKTYSLLEELTSPAFTSLVNAVVNGDPARILEEIQNIKHGNYELAGEAFKELFNIDLDTLAREAADDYLYNCLSSIDDPSELQDKCKLYNYAVSIDPTIEKQVNEALQASRANTVEGFMKLFNDLRPPFTAYALDMFIYHITYENPSILAGMDRKSLAQLETLFKKFNMNIDLKTLRETAVALNDLNKINSMLKNNQFDQAEEYYNSLPPQEKQLINTLVGADMNKILEEYKKLGRIAATANKIIELLNSKKYQEAYELWTSLPDKERLAVGELLSGSQLKGLARTIQLDAYIRLQAALDYIKRNNISDESEIEKVFEKYFAGEENEGKQLYKEYVAGNLAKQVEELVGKGDYADAVKAVVDSGVLDDKEKRAVIYYILNEIYKREGEEGLAKFIVSHADLLGKYVDKSIIQHAAMLVEHKQIAKTLGTLLSEAVQKKYGERVKHIFQQLIEYLKDNQFDQAENLILRNKRLLQGIKADADHTLMDVAMQAYTLYRTAYDIEDIAKKLDEIRDKLDENPADVDASSIENLRDKLDAELDAVEHADLIPEKDREKYVSALKQLIAYADALLTLKYLGNGEADKAEQYAKEAAGLDSKYRQLEAITEMYNTLTSEDIEALLADLTCIINKSLGRPVEVRRKPKYIHMR